MEWDFLTKLLLAFALLGTLFVGGYALALWVILNFAARL